MFPFLRKTIKAPEHDHPCRLFLHIRFFDCFCHIDQNFILSMNRSSVSDKISSIAKIVANDKLIQKSCRLVTRHMRFKE